MRIIHKGFRGYRNISLASFLVHLDSFEVSNDLRNHTLTVLHKIKRRNLMILKRNLKLNLKQLLNNQRQVKVHLFFYNAKKSMCKKIKEHKPPTLTTYEKKCQQLTMYINKRRKTNKLKAFASYQTLCLTECFVFVIAYFSNTNRYPQFPTPHTTQYKNHQYKKTCKTTN